MKNKAIEATLPTESVKPDSSQEPDKVNTFRVSYTTETVLPERTLSEQIDSITTQIKAMSEKCQAVHIEASMLGFIVKDVHNNDMYFQIAGKETKVGQALEILDRLKHWLNKISVFNNIDTWTWVKKD